MNHQKSSRQWVGYGYNAWLSARDANALSDHVEVVRDTGRSLKEGSSFERLSKDYPFR
jgi:hypothetical protein